MQEITTTNQDPAIPPFQGPGAKALRPSVKAIALTAADTEYPHKLPMGCKRFQLQCQDATALRVTFERGIIATPSSPNYWTVKANAVFKCDGLDIDQDVWIFIACDSASKVAEIVQWS